MKFLLTALNAKYIHSNPALYSLRAYACRQDLKKAADVEIAEYTINQSVEEIAAAIYEKKPDVAAISCYIWNWRMVQELIGILAAILPETRLWLGGPEVSFHTEKILEQYPQLTGVMVGEGEVTFWELLRFYRSQEGHKLQEQQEAPGMHEQAAEVGSARQAAQLALINGIVYRDAGNGQICRTPKRALTDISKLPFFYEDMADFENRIVYYESSRGCPYRCSYCLSSIDKTVRLRELELVKKELQFFLDKKVPQVKFIDRTFNCNHHHAWEIWNYIREHDNGFTNFHFEVAAGILNEEELTLLSAMRPGLVQLEIGVQTTNERTLAEICRREDIARLKKTVARLNAGKNIHIHLDLIAGLPYEDLASFQNSFNEVYRMAPSQLQLGFLKVLKGARMEEAAAAYGLVYLKTPPYEVLSTKWLSYEQLRQLKLVEEMVELFYNSGQFTRTIPVLESCFETPYALYEALAHFYKKNGYVINSPSRSERYRLLLAFACQVDEKKEMLWRELLTFDLYLRENCKSRPEFSPNLEAWKTWIHDFYLKEELERTVLKEYESCNAKQLQRMTHMEIFEQAGYKGQRTAVLFDYQKRNPLDGNAKVYYFALCGKEEE